MHSTLQISAVKNIVSGCTIKAWGCVVSRRCVKCPDQCAYRNAKVEFEPVGEEYHGN